MLQKFQNAASNQENFSKYRLISLEGKISKQFYAILQQKSI